MTSQTLRWANLTVAFLLELCALAALGYWGVQTAAGRSPKTALGVGAPLLAAVLWGLFAAPRALLGSERLTGATLDRLTHRCQIIETKGESYQLIDEGQSQETRSLRWKD